MSDSLPFKVIQFKKNIAHPVSINMVYCVEMCIFPYKIKVLVPL